MIVAGIEFPDGCPAKCPGYDEYQWQGGLCGRCPIFCCESATDEDGKPFRLIEPDDYRPDWAQEWKRWFDEGMKGRPALYLERRD